ncbi:hypothetical protein KUCAC02_025528, partial [Chaenocephalus aceratus]
SEKVERKRAASKVRVVKHREKVYSNPELLEEYRRKERERLEQDIFTFPSLSCRHPSLRQHPPPMQVPRGRSCSHLASHPIQSLRHLTMSLLHPDVQLQ